MVQIPCLHEGVANVGIRGVIIGPLLPDLGVFILLLEADVGL